MRGRYSSASGVVPGSSIVLRSGTAALTMDGERVPVVEGPEQSMRRCARNKSKRRVKGVGRRCSSRSGATIGQAQ